MRYILISLLHSIFTRGKETHDKILSDTCDVPGLSHRNWRREHSACGMSM